MKAQIHINPPVSRIDETVHFVIRNLPANTHVTVRATTNNILGLTCLAQSMATFISDSNGTVNLDTDCPISGSYDEVDIVDPGIRTPGEGTDGLDYGYEKTTHG